MLVVWLAASYRANAATPESPWLEIHSSHFTVITDAGEKRGREVALRFEQMRAVFESLLTKDRLNQPIPLTILALKSDEAYYKAAPLHEGKPIDVPGFFLRGDDQDFIVLNLAENEPWRAVAHDFAHMLLNYNYPPAQGWFDEGLVEYFSSIRVTDRQVEIGGDPELTAGDNHDPAGPQESNPPKTLTELLGAQVWISIPDLFAMKHDSSGGSEGTHHTLYYAESWMVMHYLLHEKKMAETGSYFGLVLNQHVPVEDAIQQAYGMSAGQFEQAVKDYFHAQTAPPGAVDSAHAKNPGSSSAATPSASQQPNVFPALVEPETSAITAKPLAEDNARALYAGVQVRIAERHEAGLKTLQTLSSAPTAADTRAAARAERAEKRTEKTADKAAQDADDDEKLLPSVAVGNEVAHRMLAWDHIEHGEFDDAIAELGDAAALNREDMWVRYYLCALKYRMAQAKHTDMSGLANMMIDLRSVLEWYPELANAYDLLAVARNEGGTATTAMQAERAAMTLSPRDELYSYHLALIYINAKKWDAAETLLERLRTGGNAQIAEQARDRLAQMGSERKYGLTGASSTASGQPQFAPQKTPFDVLDEDAAKRAEAAKADQQSVPNEKRQPKYVQGRLVSVDCSQAPAAVLTVSAEGKILKLRAADYKTILLIGADGFSCDWQNRTVTVNYKPGGTMDGELMSLEVR